MNDINRVQGTYSGNEIIQDMKSASNKHLFYSQNTTRISPFRARLIKETIKVEKDVKTGLFKG